MRSLRLLCSLLIFFFIASITSATAQTFTNSTNLLSPAGNGFEWGTSAADFNSDGWVDIYERGKLYLNNQGQGFTNIISSTGLTEGSGTFGAVFGDYDNDGYLDVLIENFGSLSILNRNNRIRTFTQVNSQANINPNILAQTCGWADFDANGTLDIFLNDDAGNNKMYRNDNHGNFVDISSSSNAPTEGNSYGMAWGDYDNDGYSDIFIATCPGGDVNHLLRNNQNGTFTNIGASVGVDNTASSWGIVWLDINNDGFQDAYIANTSNDPNLLYLNNVSTFIDISESAGVETTGGFGAAAADFDNDGWIDIYVATSGVTHSLYRNNGDSTFTNIAVSAGITEGGHDAVAVADYNNDGWMDIFTAGSPQNRMMINNGGSNNWLMIKTRGVNANHFGVGTRIVLYIDGTMQTREIRAGDSFCSQNDQLRAHFGLGTATTVDSLILFWPGDGKGDGQKIENIGVNQEICIVEDIGIVTPPPMFTLSSPSDGEAVDAHTSIELTWEDNTANKSSNLTHRVYVWGNGVNEVFTDVSGHSFALPVNILTDGNTYNWMVDATDGYSIVASHDIYSFTYNEVELLSYEKSVSGGWNLMGLPLLPDDGNYQTLFPNSNPNTLFKYDGGYVGAATMEECVGYWLNFSASETVPVQGLSIGTCTLNLTQGWNLISGPSCGVAVAEISDPGNIILGDLFGFDGAYFPAATVEQGSGYWVNTTTAGTVTMSCQSTGAIRKAGTVDPGEASAITIRDAANCAQSLYFAAEVENAGTERFALPPKAPQGAFDVRFAGDLRVISDREGRIEVQSDFFPLTVQLSNTKNPETQSYIVEALINGRVEARHQIRSNEPITITNPQVNQLQLKVELANIPEAFVLEQNYPNPFNPETQIRFGLPEAATVTVTVYNTLGQKIKTLANAPFEAGFHNLKWDATNDLGQSVSSAIYLYSITAGQYQDIKKMILLK